MQCGAITDSDIITNSYGNFTSKLSSAGRGRAPVVCPSCTGAQRVHGVMCSEQSTDPVCSQSRRSVCLSSVVVSDSKSLIDQCVNRRRRHNDAIDAVCVVSHGRVSVCRFSFIVRDETKLYDKQLV